MKINNNAKAIHHIPLVPSKKQNGLSGMKIPKTVYKHTFLGFTGTCKSISQFLNKSCIKEPVQQPAATITAFLLYIMLLEV